MGRMKYCLIKSQNLYFQNKFSIYRFFNCCIEYTDLLWTTYIIKWMNLKNQFCLYFKTDGVLFIMTCLTRATLHILKQPIVVVTFSW